VDSTFQVGEPAEVRRIVDVLKAFQNAEQVRIGGGGVAILASLERGGGCQVLSLGEEKGDRNMSLGTLEKKDPGCTEKKRRRDRVWKGQEEMGSGRGSKGEGEEN